MWLCRVVFSEGMNEKLVFSYLLEVSDVISRLNFRVFGFASFFLFFLGICGAVVRCDLDLD